MPVIQHLHQHLRRGPVGGVAAPAVHELRLLAVDAGLVEEVGEHREAGGALVALRGDGEEADPEVGAQVVADLEDQLGVLGVGRGGVRGHPWASGVIARQPPHRVGAGRVGGDVHPGTFERLDQRDPSEGGRVADRGGAQQGFGVRRDRSGQVDPGAAVGGRHRDRGRLPGRHGLHRRGDLVGRDLGPPVQPGVRAGPVPGGGHEVDQVVVDDQGRRGGDELRVGEEQPAVHDHVAVDAGDAGGAHLPGEQVDPGERVLRGEGRPGEVVGVGVVEVGVRDRAVGARTAAHGEVALGDEVEVAGQGGAVALADRVERGHEAVVGAQGVPRARDADQLGGGSGDEELLGEEAVHHAAAVRVGLQQAPLRIAVVRLAHDLPDARVEAGEPRVAGRGRRGRGRGRRRRGEGRGRVRSGRGTRGEGHEQQSGAGGGHTAPQRCGVDRSAHSALRSSRLSPPEARNSVARARRAGAPGGFTPRSAASSRAGRAGRVRGYGRGPPGRRRDPRRG